MVFDFLWKVRSFSLQLSIMIVALLWWAKPHSSVGRVTDFRTGGRWFDPRPGQYLFPGLIIETGFIPLSLLSVVSTMVMWESSKWLGKNIMCHHLVEILLKMVLNTIQSIIIMVARASIYV